VNVFSFHDLDHAERSIKFGSATTGAPGQPVRSGNLLRSFHQEGSKSAQDIFIVSRISYANIIENNFRRATLRSAVGGFHSVKITRVNFRWIVRHELAIVKEEVRMGHAR